MLKEEIEYKPEDFDEAGNVHPHEYDWKSQFHHLKENYKYECMVAVDKGKILGLVKYTLLLEEELAEAGIEISDLEDKMYNYTTMIEDIEEIVDWHRGQRKQSQWGEV